MKIIKILLLLLTVPPFYANSHHLIVTYKTDSIFISKDLIGLNEMNNIKSGIEISNRFIKPQNNINTKMQYADQIVFDTTKLQIGINAGVGFRSADLKSDSTGIFSNEYDKLKRGFYFSGSLTYLFNKNHGLGFKYSFLNSSNSNEVSYRDTLNNLINAKWTGKSRIDYWGVYYAFRYEKERHNFYGNIGLGKIIYFEDVKLDDYSYMISGSTWGGSIDLGYDYRIINNLSCGIKVSSYIGSIKTGKVSADVSTSIPDYKQGITNFDISLGLKLLIR